MALRLLTVAHSYVVGQNRRLAHEFARAGEGRWEVTCAAPRSFCGDLSPLRLAPEPGEACAVVPVTAHLSARIHAFFYGASVRKLLTQSWDVIHVWEEPYILAGAQLAAWAQRRAKYVFWTAQNVAKRYPPPFSWFERGVLRRADAWLYCGESVRTTLEARPGYRELPRAHAPLGVDVAHFAPNAERRRRLRDRLGFSDAGPPVIGFVGRFVEEKGLRVLLEVLGRLRAPYRALFVGSGPLGPLLEDFRSRDPAGIKIARASHEEVAGYLNAIDVLCAPSQTTPRWREQFGRMLVEAMASGLPVVGSDSGEIPFVVGSAGRIVAERDLAAWHSALTDLLGDDAQRRELGDAGRQRAVQHYDWSVVASRQLAFFDELVSAG